MNKIILCLIAATFTLVSCSKVTVYKFVDSETVGMNPNPESGVFLVRELSKEKSSYFSKIVKNKIVNYLSSLGYKATSEFSGSMPEYVILFDWQTKSHSEQSTMPVYKEGPTFTTNGSGYSYSSGYFDYRATTKASGEIQFVPYTKLVYDASLTVLVNDLGIEDKKSSLVWGSRSFFSGDEAMHIEQAVNYLIPPIFDRFGMPTDGMAEKYEFTGDEREVKFLKSLDKPHEIMERNLVSPGKFKESRNGRGLLFKPPG